MAKKDFKHRDFIKGPITYHIACADCPFYHARISSDAFDNMMTEHGKLKGHRPYGGLNLS